MGTLQYMAPEQVEGNVDEIDARTDIFSFGVVVYEMATGKKAFEGKSAASVIGKIMEHDPPPISTLQPMTPPTLDRVVKRCLAKDKEERWQTAYDLWHELKWIAEGGSETGVPTVAPAIPTLTGWRRALPWAVAVVLSVVVGITVWNLRPQPAPTSQPITRLTVTPPPTERLGARDAGLVVPVVAFSPGGTRLVYVANQQLYLRPMDSLEARPLAGTEGAINPFFSPDGQWVGFFADGKLKKVSISGGAPLTLCNAPQGRGGSWGTDDTIVFGKLGAGLSQVSAAGGTPQELTTLKEGETQHFWPHSLSGGKAVLFSVWSGNVSETSRVDAQSLETGERRALIPGATYARYAPTGHLIFANIVNAGTLMVVPFDLDRVEVTGAPVPIVEGVMQSTLSGLAQFSFSRNGSLVYVPGSIQEQEIVSKLVWVDRQGAVEPLAAPLHGYRHPASRPTAGGWPPRC